MAARGPGLRNFPTHLPARDSRNLIIAARGADVAYPEHAGALSIKCVFQGREIYEVNGARHAVDEASYLLLNNGQRYSCHIRSEREVEVFTVFFLRRGGPEEPDHTGRSPAG